MPNQEAIRALIEQLGDPSRSSQALLALLMKGEDGVRALAEFLLSSKPSCLPEARLLAVEGLSILKGPEVLSVLVGVASQRLDQISDPVVRLAEETVASRAALALADFHSPRAREELLKLLEGKPLIGVAEAFAKSWDLRAIPYLVSWLEDDFVAEAASRALRVCGRMAFSALIESLGKKDIQHDRETGMSQRRRARILEILADILRSEEINLIEAMLDDPFETVRLNAARAVLAQELVCNRSAPLRLRFFCSIRRTEGCEQVPRRPYSNILLEDITCLNKKSGGGTRRRISARVLPKGEHSRNPPTNSQERQAADGGTAMKESLRIAAERAVKVLGGVPNAS